MTEPRPVYDAPSAEVRAHVERYMQMRAVTIQYLRMLEDVLVEAGMIRPADRACLTREERRVALRAVDTNSQSL